MPTSVKQLTIFLTVLFMLSGDLRTLAEITLTFDIHGTGSNKDADNNPQTTSFSNKLDPITPVNQSKDTNAIEPVLISNTRVDAGSDINIADTRNVTKPADGVRKSTDSLAPVNQSKDETKLEHVVVNERTVEYQNGVNETMANDKGSPDSAVSVIQEAITPLNQTNDNKDILPIINKGINVETENSNAANVSSDRGKPASVISVREEKVKHVNKDEKTLHLLPVVINVTTRPSADVSPENKTRHKETPTFLVSKSNSSASVEQSKDTSKILPVVIGDTRHVNHVVSVNENDAPKASISRSQETIGQVNQSKDTSAIIKPDLTGMTKIDVDNSVNVNNAKENGSIIAEVSFVNSTKPMDQGKDIDVISPVVTNTTKINDNVNIDKENVQVPVNQATDEGVLKPVKANITSVKEVDNSKGILDFNITVPPPLIVIDDKLQPISDIPSVDLRKRYNSIGTEFCNEKNRCNSTIPSKSCFCDAICGVLNDCCEDAETSQSLKLNSNQFTCSYVTGVSNFGEGLMIVSKCSPVWNDDVTRRLCESETDNNYVYSRIPVSSQTVAEIIYKNRYCAHCNNVFRYDFWKAEVECVKNSSVIDVSDTGNCELSFQMPNTTAKFRKCERNLNIISSCKTTFIDEEIRKKCINDFYSVTYSNEGDMYRNKYCAMCNGVSLKNLYCQSQQFHAVERMKPTFVYSFRMIVDFNSKLQEQNEQITPFQECNDNEIYDPFSKSCREIFCPPYTKPVRGKCHPVSQNIVEIMNNRTMFNTTENCTLTIIEESEFKISNDTNVITFRDIIFNDTEYWKNGTDIFVCLEKLNISSTTNNSKLRYLYPFSPVESYVSFIGLILSITGSILTLIVYVMFPQQLLNTPGKNVMCLIISLVVSQVLFLVASEVATLQYLCVTIAIMMHYFFLCSFCWMNVIAFDLWVTFSHKFVSVRHQSLNSRRFYYYSFYAWCLPLLIVGVADILNFIEFDGKSTNSFIPNYGKGVCWITSRNALLLFFAGPLAVFKVFDFICFGFTVYHITKARRQGTFARKGTSASAFVINLRLSIVMGLTWAFAFLANFTNNNVMWYLFIICNTLQGLFIAISFMCTRKVLKLFREKYDKKFSRSSETQMTTRPSYKSSE